MTLPESARDPSPQPPSRGGGADEPLREEVGGRVEDVSSLSETALVAGLDANRRDFVFWRMDKPVPKRAG